jgi:prepilin-type N-terminal cleavage/methylation domain-containing protein
VLTVDRKGFTLIEMVVAIVILTLGILGLGASAGQMMGAAARVAVKAEALQTVEGRISQIMTDPQYDSLNSFYGGTETDLPGLTGYEMVTTITHRRTRETDGRYTDYKVIMVSLSGPGLGKAVSRTLTVAAP